MWSRRWIALIAGGILVGALAGCGSSPAPERSASALGDDAITVGSFDFPESELLGELYSQALEGAGFEVRRAFGIGPREIVSPALAQGLVELVPEYAGTALRFASLGRDAPTADAGATHEALLQALEPTTITALDAAPAQNANTFVVNRDVAEREGLSRLSDLKDAAGQLTFGGPPECPTRPLCLQGLEQVYDLSFKAVLTLDAGGAKTHDALDAGDVDVALLFTTDPALGEGRYVELTDDRRLQPAENVTPLLRREVEERWGQPVVDAINQVSQRLTTEGLRDLNAQVATASAADVAAAWLEEQGLR